MTTAPAPLFSQDIPHDWEAVEPSDSDDLPFHRGLWISEPGTVVIMNQGGRIIPMGNLPVGWFIIGRFRRVMEASTATVVRAI